jgi:CYTH domain-containing protein
MTREMMKRIKESKQRAAELVRYANPKSKSKPSIEHVTEILAGSIPYRTERPVITNINITRYSVNRLIRTARFLVETVQGETWEIDAYENLTGRTLEEKEQDKAATYPSGLFNIFHKKAAV